MSFVARLVLLLHLLPVVKGVQPESAMTVTEDNSGSQTATQLHNTFPPQPFQNDMNFVGLITDGKNVNDSIIAANIWFAKSLFQKVDTAADAFWNDLDILRKKDQLALANFGRVYAILKKLETIKLSVKDQLIMRASTRILAGLLLIERGVDLHLRHESDLELLEAILLELEEAGFFDGIGSLVWRLRQVEYNTRRIIRILKMLLRSDLNSDQTRQQFRQLLSLVLNIMNIVVDLMFEIAGPVRHGKLVGDDVLDAGDRLADQLELLGNTAQVGKTTIVQLESGNWSYPLLTQVPQLAIGLHNLVRRLRRKPGPLRGIIYVDVTKVNVRLRTERWVDQNGGSVEIDLPRNSPSSWFFTVDSVAIATENAFGLDPQLARLVGVELLAALRNWDSNIVEDFRWSGWSGWSACSVTCGAGGFRYKRRICLSLTGVVCSGIESEESICSGNFSCDMYMHVVCPGESEDDIRTPPSKDSIIPSKYRCSCDTVPSICYNGGYCMEKIEGNITGGLLKRVSCWCNLGYYGPHCERALLLYVIGFFTAAVVGICVGLLLCYLTSLLGVGERDSSIYGWSPEVDKSSGFYLRDSDSETDEWDYEEKSSEHPQPPYQQPQQQQGQPIQPQYQVPLPDRHEHLHEHYHHYVDEGPHQEVDGELSRSFPPNQGYICPHIQQQYQHPDEDESSSSQPSQDDDEEETVRKNWISEETQKTTIEEITSVTEPELEPELEPEPELEAELEPKLEPEPRPRQEAPPPPTTSKITTAYQDESSDVVSNIAASPRKSRDIPSLSKARAKSYYPSTLLGIPPIVPCCPSIFDPNLFSGDVCYASPRSCYRHPTNFDLPMFTDPVAPITWGQATCQFHPIPGCESCDEESLTTAGHVSPIKSSIATAGVHSIPYERLDDVQSVAYGGLSTTPRRVSAMRGARDPIRCVNRLDNRISSLRDSFPDLNCGRQAVRFNKLPTKQLLEERVTFAEQGVPLTPVYDLRKSSSMAMISGRRDTTTIEQRGDRLHGVDGWLTERASGDGSRTRGLGGLVGNVGSYRSIEDKRFGGFSESSFRRFNRTPMNPRLSNFCTNCSDSVDQDVLSEIETSGAKKMSVEVPLAQRVNPIPQAVIDDELLGGPSFWDDCGFAPNGKSFAESMYSPWNANCSATFCKPREWQPCTTRIRRLSSRVADAVTSNPSANGRTASFRKLVRPSRDAEQTKDATDFYSFSSLPDTVARRNRFERMSSSSQNINVEQSTETFRKTDVDRAITDFVEKFGKEANLLTKRLHEMKCPEPQKDVERSQRTDEEADHGSHKPNWLSKVTGFFGIKTKTNTAIQTEGNAKAEPSDVSLPLQTSFDSNRSNLPYRSSYSMVSRDEASGNSPRASDIKYKGVGKTMKDGSTSTSNNGAVKGAKNVGQQKPLSSFGTLAERTSFLTVGLSPKQPSAAANRSQAEQEVQLIRTCDSNGSRDSKCDELSSKLEKRLHVQNSSSAVSSHRKVNQTRTQLQTNENNSQNRNDALLADGGAQNRPSDLEIPPGMHGATSGSSDLKGPAESRVEGQPKSAPKTENEKPNQARVSPHRKASRFSSATAGRRLWGSKFPTVAHYGYNTEIGSSSIHMSSFTSSGSQRKESSGRDFGNSWNSSRMSAKPQNYKFSMVGNQPSRDNFRVQPMISGYAGMHGHDPRTRHTVTQPLFRTLQQRAAPAAGSVPHQIKSPTSQASETGEGYKNLNPSGFSGASATSAFKEAGAGASFQPNDQQNPGLNNISGKVASDVTSEVVEQVTAADADELSHTSGVASSRPRINKDQQSLSSTNPMTSYLGNANSTKKSRFTSYSTARPDRPNSINDVRFAFPRSNRTSYPSPSLKLDPFQYRGASLQSFQPSWRIRRNSAERKFPGSASLPRIH